MCTYYSSLLVRIQNIALINWTPNSSPPKHILHYTHIPLFNGTIKAFKPYELHACMHATQHNLLNSSTFDKAVPLTLAAVITTLYLLFSVSLSLVKTTVAPWVLMSSWLSVSSSCVCMSTSIMWALHTREFYRKLMIILLPTRQLDGFWHILCLHSSTVMYTDLLVCDHVAIAIAIWLWLKSTSQTCANCTTVPPL